jgi:Icc protein
LHVTDPHLFADPEAGLRGTVTHESLQRVLDHIMASDWPADIVAVTGDLIQDDSAEAYERFCDQFSQLGLPIHCIPGNHDIRELMRRALDRPSFHYCESVRIGGWTIVGIDSCLAGTAAGEVSPEEMDRLGRVLEESEDDHVLVCLHHPPLPVGSKWLDSVGLQNADTFLEFIGQHGQVRSAIFGHVHQPLDETVNGVRIIGTPSTCRQFKVNSDEFAVDENPPAYRRLSLLPDGTLDEELIWLDT